MYSLSPCLPSRTLCLWDYADPGLCLTHRFAEDIYSISLHPTGEVEVVAESAGCSSSVRSCLFRTYTIINNITKKISICGWMRGFKQGVR